MSITTRNGLGVRGSNPVGARFSRHIQPSVQWVPSLGVKQPGRGADLTSPGSIMGAAISLTPSCDCLIYNRISFLFYLLIHSSTVYLKAL